MKRRDKDILWFKEVGKNDGGLVGGKGANLGEMVSFGMPVPNGFIVTSKAYFDFLEENKLRGKIKKILKTLDTTDPRSFQTISSQIKKLILKATMSPQLAKKIINHYLKLGGLLSQSLVAIRSSATAEDLPTASFAGQQATFLNVRGEANVVEMVKECWASLFEARAIFYREEKGFEHLKVGIAVPVQEMIPAEVSGVMFTIDPVTNQKNRILIEAIWGLGELIVQGKVSPDQYLVEKGSLAIIKRRIEKQTIQMKKVGNSNRDVRVPTKLQVRRKLSDKQIVQLSKLGKKIHRHYYYPQDIEWILNKKKLYIVQTRPVTTIDTQKTKPAKKSKKIKKKPLLIGVAASPGIAAGPVKIIKSAREINRVKPGDILVTVMTTPDFVPAMKNAVAIVTERGGQTSHAAIVSRELGVPCIVGAEKATKVLKNKQMITVNGAAGEIYAGGLISGDSPSVSIAGDQKTPPTRSKNLLLKTATKVYVNLGEPELAQKISQQNVDGVGLLRAEFMIAKMGIHPKKLIKDGRQKFFVDQLSEGIAQFCRAFAPRPVVYRSTDFKTNEYRHLVGGKSFEPEESNPFMGFRGAFRYLADPRVFELELKAIKKVRNKHQLRNLWLMVPFCRTPQEFQAIKKIIVSEGLNRSPTFKLWLMVEVPSNVILLEDFIKLGIDGVSIGSNDLTMLILGVDRDNPELAQVFNEQDKAVLWAIEQTIKTAKKLKVTSSICGQAPTTYPDLVEKLVNWGITSLSVNPDAIGRTREIVYKTEEKLITKKKK